MLTKRYSDRAGWTSSLGLGSVAPGQECAPSGLPIWLSASLFVMTPALGLRERKMPLV